MNFIYKKIISIFFRTTRFFLVTKKFKYLVLLPINFNFQKVTITITLSLCQTNISFPIDFLKLTNYSINLLSPFLKYLNNYLIQLEIILSLEIAPPLKFFSIKSKNSSNPKKN